MLFLIKRVPSPRLKNAKLSYEGEPLNEEWRRMIKSLVYHSSHPLSRRIFEFLQDVDRREVDQFEELKGQGISGKINGQEIRIGSAEFIKRTISEPGLRQQSMIAINGQIIGTFIYDGSYRPGLKNILEQIKHWAQVSLLSGR